MIAIARSPEPRDLTAERQRRLARLLIDWQNDAIDPGEPEAVATFVADRRSWLDAGYGQVRGALSSDQHRKCAYCERKLDPSAHIDHHRPRRPERSGNQVTGPLVHTGYFWLTWSYANLLLACNTCNGQKGNRYPLDGRRAEVWGALGGESPQWIDPASEDPSTHVGFVFDDVLGKWSIVGRTARGAATIRDLKLHLHDADWQDHLALVSRVTARYTFEEAGLNSVAAHWRRALDALLAPEQPFRALTHAWLVDCFDEAWCWWQGVHQPGLPTEVRPDATPLWTDRPDLASLPERLQLWVRALGDNPVASDLDRALCAFADERAWTLAELARWLPRSQSTLRNRLTRLSADGALDFDGQTARQRP